MGEASYAHIDTELAKAGSSVKDPLLFYIIPNLHDAQAPRENVPVTGCVCNNVGKQIKNSEKIKVEFMAKDDREECSRGL